jgi:hypothetical protein
LTVPAARHATTDGAARRGRQNATISVPAVLAVYGWTDPDSDPAQLHAHAGRVAPNDPAEQELLRLPQRNKVQSKQ